MNQIKPPFKIPIRLKGHGIGQFFSSMPTWALLGLIIFLCVLTGGTGAYIAQQRYLSGVKFQETSIGTAVAAIFGLLAFMLGFTFSLTWSRFANRNSIVIKQAQTIGTCYLRTSLIPEKQKQEIRRLIREYTTLLLAIQTEDEIEKKIVRFDELQITIWQQTATLAQEDVDSELRSLFISAINELISLSIERKILGLIFRIPNPIWASLLILSGMGMFAYGYLTGTNGVLHIAQMILLAVSFGVVIVLIADLDSKGLHRRFKVTQVPLQYVQDMMEKDIP